MPPHAGGTPREHLKVHVRSGNQEFLILGLHRECQESHPFLSQGSSSFYGSSTSDVSEAS